MPAWCWRSGAQGGDALLPTVDARLPPRRDRARAGERRMGITEMTQRFWRPWQVVAAVTALLLAACAGRVADLHAESVATPAATSAEEAVRSAVEATGAVYAGDCATTRSPDDIGKVCAKLIGSRGAMHAYLIGRTFSEFSTWVFVEETPAGWRVVGTAPLDFHAPALDIPWPR